MKHGRIGWKQVRVLNCSCYLHNCIMLIYFQCIISRQLPTWHFVAIKHLYVCKTWMCVFYFDHVFLFKCTTVVCMYSLIMYVCLEHIWSFCKVVVLHNSIIIQLKNTLWMLVFKLLPNADILLLDMFVTLSGSHSLNGNCGEMPKPVCYLINKS